MPGEKGNTTEGPGRCDGGKRPQFPSRAVVPGSYVLLAMRLVNARGLHRRARDPDDGHRDWSRTHGGSRRRSPAQQGTETEGRLAHTGTAEEGLDASPGDGEGGREESEPRA
jgi:hypothetical protein